MSNASSQLKVPEVERTLSVPSDGVFRACSSCTSGFRRDVLESDALAQLRGLV